MRVVLQRVSRARVLVSGKEVGAIGRGLLILLGVGAADDESDVDYLADKVANLRIFTDENGKMNLSALDVGGEILVVSQFTLYGDCRKGRRPSFSSAARPEQAESLYEEFISKLAAKGLKVEQGSFGAHMQVELSNDGPVTLLLDSKGDF